MSIADKKSIPAQQIRTGNAVIDDLIREMRRHSGSVIVAGNPAQAAEIRGYGVPADDIGVLLSLPAGTAIVIGREIFERMQAEEAQLLAQLRTDSGA